MKTSTGSMLVGIMFVCLIGNPIQAGRIYVSASQGDDGNTGSIDAPVSTLSRAIELVGLEPGYPADSPIVCVETGSYYNASTLIITNPVRMVGGYQYSAPNAWTRNNLGPTVIMGPATAIRVAAPLAGTTKLESVDSVVIDGFEIQSADGAHGTVTGSDGESSICIEVAEGILFARNNDFWPGQGGDGADGASGTGGGNGLMGGDAPVPDDVPTDLGTPGNGGLSPGGMHGGRGGYGGGFTALFEWMSTIPSKGNGSGLPGNPGQAGIGQQIAASGGDATYSENTYDFCGCTPIWVATAKMEGGPGQTLFALPWAAPDGSSGYGGLPGQRGFPGANGQHGAGGGGGGGGGSFYKCSFEDIDWLFLYVNWCAYVGMIIPGGCGGGGGGGGEGGYGGEGGFAGGASIGILDKPETVAVHVYTNRFYLNDGGCGGDGGNGGSRGIGGAGGIGQPPRKLWTGARDFFTDKILGVSRLPPIPFTRVAGKGGNGQLGQTGGRGGDGGGGGGGNSCGIFFEKTGLFNVDVYNTFYSDGINAGAGGTGGNDGQSGEVKVWDSWGAPPSSVMFEDLRVWLHNIVRAEMVVDRLGDWLGPPLWTIVELTLRVEWTGDPVVTTCWGPQGLPVLPDSQSMTSTSAEYTFLVANHPEYGDPWGWETESERMSFPYMSSGDGEVNTAALVTGDEVQFTLISQMSRPSWPVVVVSNVTVIAGANGLAEASIDAGSYHEDPEVAIELHQNPSGPYAVGDTVVTLEVEDPYGVVVTDQATVTVNDETAPILEVPEAISARADAHGEAIVLIPVSAVDNADPNPTVVVNELAVYPVGTTDVLVQATDASGNTSQQIVEVVVAPEPEPVRLGGDSYLFDESTLDPFVPQGGSWQVVNGQLVQSDPSGWALARLDAGTFQTYAVTFEFTQLQGEFTTLCYARGDAGVNYRVDFGTNFCRLTMPADGDTWETRAFTVSGLDLPLGGTNGVIVAVNTEGVKVYLNRELTHDESWAGDIPLGDAQLCLGTYNATAAFDNVSVLTALELNPVVRLAFDDGTASDYSGRGNHGVLMNGATVVDDGERGKVLSLDGLDDYVDVGTDASLDLSDDGEATITAWVKMNGSKVHNSIVTKGGWDDAYSLLVNGDMSDRLWTGNDNSVYSGDSIPADTWTHVAVAINGQYASFYINGLLSGMAYQDRGGSIDDNPLNHLEVGREDRSENGSMAQWYFFGLLDDVRIYETELSILEVQAVMGTYEPGLEGFLITGCTPNGAETILEWTAIPMTETMMQYSTNLGSMPFTNLSGSLPYPVNTFTDTVNAAADQCFYRVMTVP